MMKKKVLAFLMASFLLTAGCMQPLSLAEQTAPLTGAQPAAALSAQDLFSDRDFETGYEESEAVRIQLSGASAVCDSDAVVVEGSRVTITDEGVYLLSGTLTDGMIIIDAGKKDKIQLVLDNAQIHSADCAPVFVTQADKVFVTLAEGTDNALSNGGSFTPMDDSNIDAVIFSRDDLTLNGEGRLTIASPAGHGVACKDSLTVTGGQYEVSCASHALSAKDDVCIAGGEFTLTSGKDGVHAEHDEDAEAGFVCITGGVFSISAEGDGISASSLVQIEGGSFEIVTGGGSVNGAAQTASMQGGFMGGGRHSGGRRGGFTTETTASSDSVSTKGVKSGADLIISGGVFSISSADDSIHSNASLTVQGGTFDIASGDDAFHAEETLTVESGVIRITESYEGLEALHILLSGGEITLFASDDGLNAAGGVDASGMTGGRDGMGGRRSSSSSNGSIKITGGTLHVTAYGDGLDANGSIEISGGHTIVCGPTQGDTATLDFNTQASVSGGVFIGTGASGMAQTFTHSTQGVIAVKVGQQQAGAQIALTDSSGKTLIAHAPELPFCILILSDPTLVSGETYHLTVGSSSGEITAG